MEAVPRMPMLSLELKRSLDYVEFGPILKQYIRDHYGEDPSHYNKGCSDLEQLRQSAVHISHDFMGCSTLKKYYAQLQFLQGRFPMTEGGEAAIAFTWEDIHSGRETTLEDIKFEQACVLYNIGALHSILGAMDTRQSADGMKVSCTHFQCSAWAFEHLRDHFGSSAMSLDMSHELLTFQIHLMLAQAQECILEKSMMDSRKSTITAKVAAQIVDFYQTALKNLDVCNQEELVVMKKYKEWKKRIDLKVLFYTCITNYYMGRQAEEQQKWGECLAYYTISQEKLNECIKMGKNEGVDIQDTLRFTNDVVAGKQQSSKKDNDFVYHDKIPSTESLPEVKGACLVKGIPFNPNDPEISGPDIFQKLVPMEAHEASSLYSEEKAQLLRRVCGEISEKNEELVHFMSSLQLDSKTLTPEPERLPQDLLEKCAAISVRPNAIKDLLDAMKDVSSVATEVEMGLREIGQLLGDEEDSEAEFQKTFGKRAPNVILSEIQKEAEMFEEGHKKGSQSNADLHKAMNIHINNLKLLSGPLDELQKALPSQDTEKGPEQEAIVRDLQKLLAKVEEMKSQRESWQEQLRKQVHEDDITNVIVTAEGGDKQALFREHLKKHDKLIGLIQQNLAAQPNILKALTDANARYANIRKTTGETAARREAMIQDLKNSYDVYADLLAKSKKGHDFYKKLETNVNRLLSRCRGVCKVQQEERDQITNRAKPKAPPPSRPVAPKPATTESYEPGSPPVTSSVSTVFEGPKLKDYLPFMKPKTFGKKDGRQSPPLDPIVQAYIASQSGSLPNSAVVSPVHIPQGSGSHPGTPSHYGKGQEPMYPSPGGAQTGMPPDVIQGRLPSVPRGELPGAGQGRQPSYPSIPSNVEQQGHIQQPHGSMYQSPSGQLPLRDTTPSPQIQPSVLSQRIAQQPPVDQSKPANQNYSSVQAGSQYQQGTGLQSQTGPGQAPKGQVHVPQSQVQAQTLLPNPEPVHGIQQGVGGYGSQPQHIGTHLQPQPSPQPQQVPQAAQFQQPQVPPQQLPPSSAPHVQGTQGQMGQQSHMQGFNQQPHSLPSQSSVATQAAGIQPIQQYHSLQNLPQSSLHQYSQTGAVLSQSVQAGRGPSQPVQTGSQPAQMGQLPVQPSGTMLSQAGPQSRQVIHQVQPGTQPLPQPQHPVSQVHQQLPAALSGQQDSQQLPQQAIPTHQPLMQQQTGQQMPSQQQPVHIQQPMIQQQPGAQMQPQQPIHGQQTAIPQQASQQVQPQQQPVQYQPAQQQMYQQLPTQPSGQAFATVQPNQQLQTQQQMVQQPPQHVQQYQSPPQNQLQHSQSMVQQSNPPQGQITQIHQPAVPPCSQTLPAVQPQPQQPQQQQLPSVYQHPVTLSTVQPRYDSTNTVSSIDTPVLSPDKGQVQHTHPGGLVQGQGQVQQLQQGQGYLQSQSVPTHGIQQQTGLQHPTAGVHPGQIQGQGHPIYPQNQSDQGLVGGVSGYQQVQTSQPVQYQQTPTSAYQPQQNLPMSQPQQPAQTAHVSQTTNTPPYGSQTVPQQAQTQYRQSIQFRPPPPSYSQVPSIQQSSSTQYSQSVPTGGSQPALQGQGQVGMGPRLPGPQWQQPVRPAMPQQQPAVSHMTGSQQMNQSVSQTGFVTTQPQPGYQQAQGTFTQALPGQQTSAGVVPRLPSNQQQGSQYQQGSQFLQAGTNIRPQQAAAQLPQQSVPIQPMTQQYQSPGQQTSQGQAQIPQKQYQIQAQSQGQFSVQSQTQTYGQSQQVPGGQIQPRPSQGQGQPVQHSQQPLQQYHTSKPQQPPQQYPTSQLQQPQQYPTSQPQQPRQYQTSQPQQSLYAQELQDLAQSMSLGPPQSSGFMATMMGQPLMPQPASTQSPPPRQPSPQQQSHDQSSSLSEIKSAQSTQPVQSTGAFTTQPDVQRTQTSFQGPSGSDSHYQRQIQPTPSPKSSPKLVPHSQVQPPKSLASSSHQPASAPSVTVSGSSSQHSKVSRQSSSLDEILSSSPDGKADTKIDSVLAPKVLTAQEIQQQKEEAMKNSSFPVPVKDPYSEKTKLDKFIAEVEKLAKFIEGLEKPSCSGPTPLDVIWKELMEEQDKAGRRQSLAIARCYPMKNRDQDIMPYDDTRVLLTSTKDDYINASWINELSPSCPKFIAAQSPLPQTMADFWMMVYEQGVEVIAMMSSENETGKKFPVYWPEEKGHMVQHGPITLTLQTVKEKPCWTERIIYLTHAELEREAVQRAINMNQVGVSVATKTKAGRTVAHLHYNSWPVSGFPDKKCHILQFMTEVHSFYKQQRSLLKPVVVHCSNGIGRTGMFLLIYTGMQVMNHEQGILSIQETAAKMLYKRRNCIHKKDQLKFCFEAILYYAQDILGKQGILVHKASFGDKLPGPGEKSHQWTPTEDLVFGSMSLHALQTNIDKIGTHKETHKRGGSITKLEQEVPKDELKSENKEHTDKLEDTEIIPRGSTEPLITILPDVVQSPSKPFDKMAPSNSSHGNQDKSDIDMLSDLGSQKGHSRTGSSASISSYGSGQVFTSHEGSPLHKAQTVPENTDTVAKALTDLQDPSKFTIGTSDSTKKKVTKADFTEKSSSLSDPASDPDDPLSSLDPLWSMKKK